MRTIANLRFKRLAARATNLFRLLGLKLAGNSQSKTRLNFLSFLSVLGTFNSCSLTLPYQLITFSRLPDTSQLTIRPAQFRDLNELAEVLTSSFHPSPGWLSWAYPLLKLGIYEDIRSRLYSSSPIYACLVASLPTAQSNTAVEEVVGTVEVSLRSTYSWSAVRSQFFYISNLAIRDSHRRRGIAQKLLLQCEKIALDWGYTNLSLHVLEDNHQARQLYLKIGYRLERIEPGLGNWLPHRPRRMLLTKQISGLGT